MIVVVLACVATKLSLTAIGSIVGAYEETGFRKGDAARLGMAESWYQCDA